MNNVYLTVAGIFLILASVASGMISSRRAGKPVAAGLWLAGVVLGLVLIVAGFATG